MDGIRCLPALYVLGGLSSKGMPQIHNLRAESIAGSVTSAYEYKNLPCLADFADLQMSSKAHHEACFARFISGFLLETGFEGCRVSAAGSEGLVAECDGYDQAGIWKDIQKKRFTSQPQRSF